MPRVQLLQPRRGPVGVTAPPPARRSRTRTGVAGVLIDTNTSSRETAPRASGDLFGGATRRRDAGPANCRRGPMPTFLAVDAKAAATHRWTRRLVPRADPDVEEADLGHARARCGAGPAHTTAPPTRRRSQPKRAVPPRTLPCSVDAYRYRTPTAPGTAATSSSLTGLFCCPRSVPPHAGGSAAAYLWASRRFAALSTTGPEPTDEPGPKMYPSPTHESSQPPHGVATRYANYQVFSKHHLRVVNRRPPPYHDRRLEDASQDVARVVSDVSVCVRKPMSGWPTSAFLEVGLARRERRRDAGRHRGLLVGPRHD